MTNFVHVSHGFPYMCISINLDDLDIPFARIYHRHQHGPTAHARLLRPVLFDVKRRNWVQEWEGGQGPEKDWKGEGTRGG